MVSTATSRVERRLRLAFGGVAFSLLLMAVAALVATDRLSRLAELTSLEALPATRDALRLSEQGALLAVSLPALVASPDAAVLARRWSALEANLGQVRALLDGPNLGAAPAPARAAIADQLDRYAAVLGQLRAASAERLRLTAAQTGSLAQLRALHAELTDTVGPMIYGTTSLSRLLARGDARALQDDIEQQLRRREECRQTLVRLRAAVAAAAPDLSGAVAAAAAALAETGDGPPEFEVLRQTLANARGNVDPGPALRTRLDRQSEAALVALDRQWRRDLTHQLGALRDTLSHRVDDTAARLGHAFEIESEGHLLLALLTNAAEADSLPTLQALQDRAGRALTAFHAAARGFAEGPLAERNPVLAGSVETLKQRLSLAADADAGIIANRARELRLANDIRQLLDGARALAGQLTAHIGEVVDTIETAAARTRARTLAQRDLTLGLLGIACLIGLTLSALVAWITSRTLTRDDEALRKARASAEDANLILAAVGYSARRILGATSWHSEIDRVLGRLGSTSRADHVVIFEHGPSASGGVVLHSRFSWSRDGRLPERLSRPLDLAEAGLARWSRRLARAAPAFGDVDDLPAAERPALRLLGIKSLLVIRIQVAGAWWGQLVVGLTRQQRTWPPRLVAALGTAADMIGAAIAHARADAQVRQAATVFENTGEGVMILDRGDRVVAVNRAFTALTGYPAEEIIGGSPLGLAGSGQARDSLPMMRRILRRDGHWRGEIEGRRRNGSVFPAWLSISAIRAPDGQPRQYAAVFSDISALKRSEQKLDFLAHHDALTGLPNRILLQDRIDGAIARARRRGEQVALLFLDLDRFKNINDSLGHAVGDALLKQVAARLVRGVRETDTVARLGGDEFVVVLEGLPSPRQAEDISAGLVELFRAPFLAGDHRLFVSASIGMTLHPQHGGTAAELIRNADTAMYQAKAAGKDTWRPYTAELTRAARRRLSLEGRLRGAVERGELTLHFQPQCQLEDGRIVALEALLRWRSPDDGRLLAPGAFLPLARESGLIGDIGRWVIASACRACEQWHCAGFDGVRVNVNLSVEQLDQDDIVATVRDALSQSRLPGSALELELSEDSATANPGRIRDLLLRLRGLGVSLAIDDFGTGYSSLSHLRRLPFSTLKIDNAFVADIPDDVNGMAIAHAVVALAHTLQMSVVAEGVETPAQLHYLRRIGCDLVQGHLFRRPLPAEEVLPLLRSAEGRIRVRAATPVK